MSNERTRDRGNLFENTQKRKPSQPDMQGDCSIAGVNYEIRAWRRDDQLTLSLAPPRGDQNTYPPEVFHGALDAVPVKPVRANPRAAAAAAPAAPVPAWVGDIESEEVAYTVRAFEKQGKSGLYFTLSFERTEKSTHSESLAEPDDSETE